MTKSSAVPGLQRAGQPNRSWSRRLSSPVRTRTGGFAPFKALVFALLFAPALWLGWQYVDGELGARPVLALVHGSGLWALRMVIIALALTPSARLLEWQRLALIRRMIGVASAIYASAHLTLYCAQQNFRLLHVASEILHRFYLTIGFIVLVTLVTLAATSTDGAMRRLGRDWKRLHRLIYPAAVLGLLHYFLQAKTQVFPAVVLAGLFVWLIAWRLAPMRWRNGLWGVLGLGVIATLGTAGIEAGWYALTTGINVQRIFLANFRFVHPRPSAYVAAWSAGALLIIAAAKLRAASGRAPRAVPADPPAPAL